MRAPRSSTWGPLGVEQYFGGDSYSSRCGLYLHFDVPLAMINHRGAGSDKLQFALMSRQLASQVRHAHPHSRPHNQNNINSNYKTGMPGRALGF